jgi:hypothetical protein
VEYFKVKVLIGIQGWYLLIVEELMKKTLMMVFRWV